MRQFAWSGLAVLLVVTTLLWLWAAAVHPRIYVEHGPMENFQVGCLVLGCALYAWRIRGARQSHERVFFAALALFYATFFIREFDTRQFDWPVADAILSGMVRNLWIGALWLIIAYFVYRYRAGVLAFTWKWLGSPAGRLLLIAGLFWVFAAAADKIEPFGAKPRDMLAEEVLEVNAALLMALSAIISILRRHSVLATESPRWTPAAEAHDPPI